MRQWRAPRAWAPRGANKWRTCLAFFSETETLGKGSPTDFADTSELLKTVTLQLFLGKDKNREKAVIGPGSCLLIVSLFVNPANLFCSKSVRIIKYRMVLTEQRSLFHWKLQKIHPSEHVTFWANGRRSESQINRTKSNLQKQREIYYRTGKCGAKLVISDAFDRFFLAMFYSFHLAIFCSTIFYITSSNLSW